MCVSCRLSKKFSVVASYYGQMIIRELCLDPAQKTIRSLDVGGVAGGTPHLHKTVPMIW